MPRPLGRNNLHCLRRSAEAVAADSASGGALGSELFRRQLTGFLRNGTRQGIVWSKAGAIWLFDLAQPGEAKLTFDSGRAPLWTPTSGRFSKWRADGKELFYRTPGKKMMVVSKASGGGSFRNGTPQRLFDAGDIPVAVGATTAVPFDVTADGQRFLVSSMAG